jgi:PAS domain S-box-containing protein/putative nucleotidyltransferase with HDIG domain
MSLRCHYKILCVDDNKHNLFTLTTLLKTIDGVCSLEALDAKEALNILLKEKIDLILLDVQMPDINGFELAKMVKSNKKSRDIPIIFVTAVFKNEEFIKEGFSLGAVDYITKPIDDNKLLNKISLYLKLFDQKNRAQEKEKRLFEIAQSINDGIYTLDLNNNTTFINQYALDILGFQKHELMGKEIHNFIHYKDRFNQPVALNRCKIHAVAREGVKTHFSDEVLIKRDGSFLPVSMCVTPLFDDNEIVGIIAIFHDKSKEQKLIALEEEKVHNQEQIIHSMINMIESRDSYTAGHTRRVSYYCGLIAKVMNYSEQEIEVLKKAAWLHDLGKVSTPDTVLLKPGKLSDLEYGLIKEHLTSGYEMLYKIDQYREIANIMREHHERYDGLGYPRGLKEEEILPLSRIIIVADAFDAMTTNRVYKPKKSLSIALNELKSLSKKQFHPEVVSATLIALKDVKLEHDSSQLPLTRIEKERFSYFYKDQLTNLFKIDYIQVILEKHSFKEEVILYKIELHHFSLYNKQEGWSQGDLLLKSFVSDLERLFVDSTIFRFEGDDFFIISETEIAIDEKTLKEESVIATTLVDVTITRKKVHYSKEAIETFIA